MRLLDTETYKLHNLPPGSKPEYAILSHRWQDQEVTLQNFQDPEFWRNGGESTLGWQKIKSFCDLARYHRLQWAWIDTCCIDKSSSAELSEGEEVHSVHEYASSSDSLDSFKRSKWFTRGWTLQELLAPSTLLFYDSSWLLIGSRCSLCEEVSTITKIPAAILFSPLRFSPFVTSIAQRMSWAATRQTSRPEDEAYCLLGIFGVNMPLLYGEGKQAAFHRLQLEIIRVSDDESIFAWKEGDERGSIFADAPHCFSRSFDILDRRGFRTTIRQPYSISNKGLSIRMEMYPFSRDKIKSVFGIHGGLAYHVPWSELWIAPINCTENGRQLAVILRKRDQWDEVYSRGALAEVRSELVGGERRDISVLVSHEMHAWRQREFAEGTITSIHELQEAFVQDLVRHPNMHRTNLYGSLIFNFQLRFIPMVDPVVLFIVSGSTNERTAFAPLLEHLGLPLERIEFYRRQVPNITS